MPPQEFPPHPILANFVQHFWYVERNFTQPNNSFDILPDTHIELIFNFGEPCYLLVNDQRCSLAPCFVVGLLDETVRIHANGLVKLACARFYPWGFYQLFGEILLKPAIGVRPSHSIFDAQAVRIQTQLDDSLDSGIHELQHFLIERALKITLHEPELIQAAQLILDQKGNLNLEEIAAATFLSIRTLRRKFANSLGLAPKSLARTARFEAVRDALWQNPNVDLSDLALGSGYADQAHMQREFRQFSGRTPRQFAREMREVHQAIGR